MGSQLEFIYQPQKVEINDDQVRAVNQKVAEFLIKIAIQKAFSK